MMITELENPSLQRQLLPLDRHAGPQQTGQYADYAGTLELDDATGQLLVGQLVFILGLAWLVLAGLVFGVSTVFAIGMWAALGWVMLSGISLIALLASALVLLSKRSE